MTTILIGGPLIDAADPPPGYVPPACPIPGDHGTLEPLPLAPPFTYVCTPHIDAAMQTLGSPSRSRHISSCTACWGTSAGWSESANPYGIVRVWPNHSFLGEHERTIRACRDHLTAALTALLTQP